MPAKNLILEPGRIMHCWELILEERGGAGFSELWLWRWPVGRRTALRRLILGAHLRGMQGFSQGPSCG